MKKILLVLIVSFLTIKGMGQQKKLQDLVGRWEIVGERENGASLEVIDSSTIILVYGGERKKIRDYSIDFTKSPIWFDFSTIGDSASMVTVKSLIEIVSEGMIKWQLFVDEERTPHFSSAKGELFFLRKTIATTVATTVSNN